MTPEATRLWPAKVEKPTGLLTHHICTLNVQIWNRITSYNVCYTKLLRIALIAKGLIKGRFASLKKSLPVKALFHFFSVKNGDGFLVFRTRRKAHGIGAVLSAHDDMDMALVAFLGHAWNDAFPMLFMGS